MLSVLPTINNICIPLISINIQILFPNHLHPPNPHHQNHTTPPLQPHTPTLTIGIITLRPTLTLTLILTFTTLRLDSNECPHSPFLIRASHPVHPSPTQAHHIWKRPSMNAYVPPVWPSTFCFPKSSDFPFSHTRVANARLSTSILSTQSPIIPHHST